jgi:hypothetical protein
MAIGHRQHRRQYATLLDLTPRKFEQAEYRELVAAFLPRPIGNEKDLDRTWAQIETLLTKSKRSKAEDDYLALLSDLVEAWEEDHVEMPKLESKDSCGA